MIKRLADWLEKLSVGAFIVGLFQTRVQGLHMDFQLMAIGLMAITASMIISWLLRRGEK